MSVPVCHRCGKPGQLTRLEVVKSGVRQDWEVCADCLAVLLGEVERPGFGRVCPACGLTEAMVTKTRRLGCPECYPTFASWVLTLARREGWPASYDFQAPDFVHSGATGLARTERLARLQTELLEAVEGEQFEKAAQLRDEIHALQESTL